MTLCELQEFVRSLFLFCELTHFLVAGKQIAIVNCTEKKTYQHDVMMQWRCEEKTAKFSTPASHTIISWIIQETVSRHF